jgi:glyoxylase-like metal-dependent hydrolase (beta-lactamase superfamily II)
MRIAALLMTLIVASALVACSPRSDTPREPANAAATAPMSKPMSKADDVQTFPVGDFSAMALRDGALEFPNDSKTFGVGRTSAEVTELLTGTGLPTDRLELSIQPLLVKTADRVLLFDTGAGANMGSSGGRLPASMAAARIDPASVTDVFISHAHGDHVGGLLRAEGALAFPNAAIHISSPEWAFLKGMNAETAAAVAIPHHTPGHSGFLITSGQSSLLYVGDTMHHFVVSVRRPDWTVGFDADAPTAQASRSALLARSAESGQRLYAVHFPFPGLGKVERGDDGFVWVPE